MTRTPATAAQIKAAVKNPNKSEGMRELLRLGMSAVEVADAFDAQYGFVYGVGKRAGLITPTPREAKAAPAKAKATRPAAKAARPAAKATAKAPARAAAKGKAAPARSPEAIRAAARRAKAKAAKA